MRKNYFARLIITAVICFALSMSVMVGCIPTEETPKSFTVTFDSNGGSSVPSQTVDSGKTVTKPDDPTRDGYDFVTWLDIDNGEYDFGAAVTKNFTLFAKWNLKSTEKPEPEKPKTFTVTFDTDGGNSIDPATVESGKKVAKPDDPAKEGYTFDKWILSDGSAFDFNSAITEDITLKAKWTKNPTVDPGGETETKYYTVTFNSNNGSEVPAQYVEDGKKAAEPTAPTRSGYVFDGWYKETALTNSYSFDTAVKTDITLHAKWINDTVTKYTVTFNSDGGSKVLPQEVARGSKATEPTDPEKAGFVFGGWYIENTLYNFNNTVTSNLTLTAKWTPVAEANVYEVKFETNGGSKVLSQEVNKNAKAVNPKDPTKSGYTFDGWYNGETEYDFNTPVTSDLTLTAKWTESTTPVENPITAKSINFNNVELTETIDKGDGSTPYQAKIFATDTVIGDIITLKGGTWEVDKNSGTIKDNTGTNVTANNRLKSTGADRTMKIDLSAYTGKVKIQFFIRSGSNSALTRGVSLAAADGTVLGTSDNFATSNPMQTFEVTVDCGSIYTLSIREGGVNFYGINFIPVAE